MSKAEEVLSTLQNEDVWYFAKQDTSFDNAYRKPIKLLSACCV